LYFKRFVMISIIMINYLLASCLAPRRARMNRTKFPATCQQKRIETHSSESG
jgi:hypothetical protein